MSGTNWLEILFQSVTLAFMLVGLLGLIIPIFPGLLVMWLAATVYAVIEALAGNVSTMDWVVFAVMTLLMMSGEVVDNVIVARKARESGTSWVSIGAGYAAALLASLFLTPLAGILATPVGMFVAEYVRLRDWRRALASTRGWLVGFGWSFAARFGIGVVMILLWLLWIWT